MNYENRIFQKSNWICVLISKSQIRELYALHVENITSDGQMKISYAVKSYSVQTTQNESPGFDWEKGNQ
jgi:hypothetical protein